MERWKGLGSGERRFVSYPLDFFLDSTAFAPPFGDDSVDAFPRPWRERPNLGRWWTPLRLETGYEAASPLLTCKLRSCGADGPSDGSHLTSIDGRLVKIDWRS
jgi:hypothetical protein